MDKVGIAVPRNVQITASRAYTFPAPTDHRHGVVGVVDPDGVVQAEGHLDDPPPGWQVKNPETAKAIMSALLVAREARPYLIGALTAMILTGVPLFLSEAVKCYYSTAFWIKITALPIALVLTLVIRDRIALDEKLETSARSRALTRSHCSWVEWVMFLISWAWR